MQYPAFILLFVFDLDIAKEICIRRTHCFIASLNQRLSFDTKIQWILTEASFVEKAFEFQLHGDAQFGFQGPVAIPGTCSGSFLYEKVKPK